MNEVLVSICCITYNHEDYIRKALDSFLMQETSFPFEIVVHDDASTDRTGAIIRSYQEKHPQIIRAIVQKENQYSQGRDTFSIAFKECRGKYIATCEGDDFWTDPSKLQRQIDYLETNGQAVASFHSVIEVLPDLTELGTYTQPPFKKKNNIYDIKDIILFDGKVIHISSLVFRKGSLIKDGVIDSLYYKSPVGDLVIMLILAGKGTFYYLARTMSCRRMEVPGGASQRLFRNKEMNAKVTASIINLYHEYDARTNFLYTKQLNYNIIKRSLNDLIDQKQYNTIVQSDYFKKQTFQKKIRIFLHYLFPSSYRRLVEKVFQRKRSKIIAKKT